MTGRRNRPEHQTAGGPSRGARWAVVQQLRSTVKNPAILSEVLRQVERQRREGSSVLNKEKMAVEKERREVAAEIARTAKLVGGKGPHAQSATSSLTELQERLSKLEHRLDSIVPEIGNLTLRSADPGEVQQALEKFEPLWEHLTTWEQERFVRALVSEVQYDGRTETVTVGFRTNGIKELCSCGLPVTEEPTDERKQTRNPIQTSSFAGH